MASSFGGKSCSSNSSEVVAIYLDFGSFVKVGKKETITATLPGYLSHF